MMFAYINAYRPKSVSVPVATLISALEHDGWGDPLKNEYYSPMDVLARPTLKKYKDEIRRIDAANLRYPIIVTDGIVVDGVHRLAKAHLAGKKRIKTYNFTPQEMNKFVINRTGDWEKADSMELHEFIELFHSRFK